MALRYSEVFQEDGAGPSEPSPARLRYSEVFGGAEAPTVAAPGASGPTADRLLRSGIAPRARPARAPVPDRVEQDAGGLLRSGLASARGARQTGERGAAQGPGMSALPESWLGRFAEAYGAYPSLSRNLAGMLADRFARIDPATGEMTSEVQRRQERNARIARELVAAGAPVPEAVLRGITPEAAGALGLGARKRELGLSPGATGRWGGATGSWEDKGGVEQVRQALQGLASGDPALLAMLAGEATDPLALAVGPAGGGASLPQRMAALAAIGAAYEGAAGAAEQTAGAGRIYDPAALGGRAALGAAGGALLEGAAGGLRALLQRRARGARLSPEEQGLVDDALRSGLFEIGPQGEVIPSREPLRGGPLREFLGEQAGTRAAGLEDVGLPSADASLRTMQEPPVGAGSVSFAEARRAAPAAPQERAAPADTPAKQLLRAQELERLAGQAQDIEVQQLLRIEAERARQAAAGQAPKLTQAERIRRLRIVRPEQDDLLTAVRKWGGIDTALEPDYVDRFSHLARRQVGLPEIERPGKGLSLDALAERAWQAGYIPSHDAQALDGLLMRASSGERVYSSWRDEFSDAIEPPDRYASDSDWSWSDEPATPPPGLYAIDTELGTVVPARELTLDDLRRIDDEINNAQIWLEQEAQSFGDRIPGAGQRAAAEQVGERAGLSDTLPERAGAEPATGSQESLEGAQAPSPAQPGQGAPAARRLEDIEIDLEVGDGAEPVRLDAPTALAQADSRVSALRAFIECLGR